MLTGKTLKNSPPLSRVSDPAEVSESKREFSAVGCYKQGSLDRETMEDTLLQLPGFYWRIHAHTGTNEVRAGTVDKTIVVLGAVLTMQGVRSDKP